MFSDFDVEVYRLEHKVYSKEELTDEFLDNFLDKSVNFFISEYEG